MWMELYTYIVLKKASLIIHWTFWLYTENRYIYLQYQTMWKKNKLTNLIGYNVY